MVAMASYSSNAGSGKPTCRRASQDSRTVAAIECARKAAR